MGDANQRAEGVVAGAHAADLKSGGAGGGELFDRLAGDDAMLEGASPFRQSARMPPRGGSRKGVPNRRSEAMRKVYERMGLPHPMLIMGQLLREGVDGLRERLIAVDPNAAPPSALDVLGEYRKIAEGLLPYLEGKAPVVTEDGREHLPVLVLGDLAAARVDLLTARSDGAMAIDDDLDAAMAEFQRKQGFASAG